MSGWATLGHDFRSPKGREKNEGRNRRQTPSDKSDGTGVPALVRGLSVVCVMHEDTVLHTHGKQRPQDCENEGVISPGKSAVEKEGEIGRAHV